VALDRGLVAADAGPVADAQERPDPEVPERARRRTFTAKYKLEVLAAYDAAGPGEKGAILRREGLYSSHIVEWRRARDAGALAGLARPRGAGGSRFEGRADRSAAEREGTAGAGAGQVRFVVDVQAKLQALLETLSESGDTGPR
jgi:transposase